MSQKNHSTTGVLIFITILLVIGTVWVSAYDSEGFLGSLKPLITLKRIPQNPISSRSGGQNAGLDSYPPATIIVGPTDPVTGEPSIALHFCQIEFEGFNDECSEKKISFLGSTFRNLVIDHQLTYVPLFRPQKDGKDVLDPDLWGKFIVNLVRYLLNPNTNVLLVTSHGAFGSFSVFSGFIDDGGDTTRFWQETQSAIWQYIIDDQELYTTLRRLGFNKFDDIFDVGKSHDESGITKLWIGLTEGFLTNIPEELKPNAVFMATCQGAYIYRNEGLHVGQRGCSPLIFDHLADIFERFDGYYSPFIRTSSPISERYKRSDVVFDPDPLAYNFSFSPSPNYLPHPFCYVDKYTNQTRYVIEVGFDTWMDTDLDRLKIDPPSGDLQYPDVIKWEPDQPFLTLEGNCSTCKGTLVIKEAYGVGDSNPAVNKIYAKLNGDTVPPVGRVGLRANFTGVSGHDPLRTIVDCTESGGDNNYPDGGSKNKKPKLPGTPLPPAPPPICGDEKINQPGEECDPPGAFCGSKPYGGDDGKAGGAFIYRCDNECKCPMPK